MNYIQKTGYFILLFIIFIVGIIIITLTTHRIFYPFWNSQPVAWTSLLKAKEGIIIDNPRQIPCSLKVPEFMKIKKLVIPYQNKERIKFMKTHQIYWSSITKLLLTNGMDNNASFTTNYITWNLSYPGSTIYCVIFGNKIIGVLQNIPIMVDTPYHQNLPCQWLDYLCVNKKYRGKSVVSKNIATTLMEHAICDSSHSNKNIKDKIPVGLFITEKKLPFAFAAQFIRMVSIIQPSLIPDQNIKPTYKIVNTIKDLPLKAFESSDVRIHGGATLEPSSNTKYKNIFWNFVINNPYHVVLSIHNEDWIYLQKMPNENGIPVFSLIGFSFKNDSDVVLHLLHYLSSQKEKEIKFIVKSPVDKLFNKKLIWELYDVHYLYFYNYRINYKNIYIPNTWNIS